MNRTLGSRLPLFAGAALLAWVLAATHAAGTLRVARSAQSRNAARVAALAQLEPDVERLLSHAALRTKLIERTETAPAFDFGQWLAAAHPAVPAPILRTQAENSGSKWACLTITAEWPGIPVAAFAHLVASAESLDPPVRLAAVTLDPLADTTAVKASAVFETITAITAIAGEQ